MVDVDSNVVLHIIEIIGVFFCAHHLWPKGVTYGEQEDWEKAHRKRHAHGSRSTSKRQSNSPVYEEASSPERPKRRERRDRDYDIEYNSRPRRGEIEYNDRERRRIRRQDSARY